MVRRQETGLIDIDPVTKHQMKNAKQKFVTLFGLRTAAKEKPIMRVEDEFECLKTLWGSEEMVFELEIHRIATALLMELAGGTGNRPTALLQLRFRDIAVALLPDPEGSEWPRVVIDWRFENTKGYLGAKDTNEIPIPDIPNEPCLLLCPHTSFLSLAFLSNAFAVTDLTPATLYSLKVPQGLGQLLIPWKESMKDVFVFRKLLRTPLGVELSDEHLSYDFLRMQLRKVGELTNFAFPVGAYCFRRGHGEALNNTAGISEAQRNLCMGHAPNSTVFQRNYLSRHITISTHDAFRNLPQQTELIRVATGMSRTIDKRRPRFLLPSQVEQARCHPKVQALLRLRESYKQRIKSRGGTIKKYRGTRLFEQYCKIQRTYISEFEFQKKAFLNEVKKKFRDEQPVVDILHQIHGLDLQDRDDNADKAPLLSTERMQVLDTLLTITPPVAGEERSRRIAAIEAMITLGRLQDGHQYPVRAVEVGSQSTGRSLPLMKACKQTQCFLCFGNVKASLHRRTKEFRSKGDLKKHLLRFHVGRMRGECIACPLDGVVLRDGQQVLRHAHHIHKTPIAY